MGCSECRGSRANGLSLSGQRIREWRPPSRGECTGVWPGRIRASRTTPGLLPRAGARSCAPSSPPLSSDSMDRPTLHHSCAYTGGGRPDRPTRCSPGSRCSGRSASRRNPTAAHATRAHRTGPGHPWFLEAGDHGAANRAAAAATPIPAAPRCRWQAGRAIWERIHAYAGRNARAARRPSPRKIPRSIARAQASADWMVHRCRTGCSDIP